MPRSHGYYPIGLSLAGRPCLIVGGGAVAQRKVRALLRYGGQVTVISPTATATLRRWARAGMIRYRPRTFRASDVAAQWLVYGATNNPHTQRAIFSAAQRRRLLVNIVDEPALCSFIAPAQVKRGDLTIAISTGGRAPGLAKRVRQDVERAIGPEYGKLLRVLERARPAVRKAVPTADDRKRVLSRLVEGGILEQFRRGRDHAARRKARQLLRQALQEWGD